jgi:SAM-dependent methyltransferase
MTERFSLSSASQVVELASNDGYLLQYFRDGGVPVLGIEPAVNVAQVATDNGIPTRVEFFGQEFARRLKDEAAADLLLGNNVLAHVPDLNDFVGGMKILLKPDGIITMEFPHLLRLIENDQFDTIYHEHFSYFSFLSARRVFAAHGLRLWDVEELPPTEVRCESTAVTMRVSVSTRRASRGCWIASALPGSSVSTLMRTTASV